MPASLSFGVPNWDGPKATSSKTVGQKSWSSGSWKTRPTRRRISGGVSGRTWGPLMRAAPGGGGGEGVRADVGAVDADGAGGGVGEDAVEVEEEGGFAGAVRADEGDGFAGVDA